MSAKRPKPEVGMRLYSLNVGNAARHCAQVLTPVVVIKVGRKYFTTERVGCAWKDETKYHIDTWHEENGGYCAGSSLYTTEKEWDDEKEAGEIRDRLYQAFSRSCMNPASSIPLETLRAIDALVKGAQQ